MTHPQETTKKEDLSKIERLSVQISLTGLSFLAQYQDQPDWLHKVSLSPGLHPGDLLFKLQEEFDRQPRLQQSAEQVVVVYHHLTFSWVPKALFDPESLADYLKYNAKLLAQDYLDYDVVEQREMVNVYVPYTNINNFFFDRYGDFTFLHSSTVFLAAISKEFSNNQTQVIANLEGGDLMLAITSQNKVLLVNSYPVSCPEDFAYYLLFAMEQLQIDPKSVPLYLCGDVSEQDDYFGLAYRYVKDVEVFSKEREPLLLKNVALACE